MENNINQELNQHELMESADKEVVDVGVVKEAFEKLKEEVGKVLIGQEQYLEKCFISLLVGGHVLIEGVPGVAKTLLAKTLSNALDLQ